MNEKGIRKIERKNITEEKFKREEWEKDDYENRY